MDRKFRWALGCMIVLSMLACLALPKFWRVSPEGMSPEVRISLLDWFQSKALERQAGRYASAGLFEDAAASWNASLANRPFHLPALLSALDNLVRIQPPSRKHVRFAFIYGQMLALQSEAPHDDVLTATDTLLRMGAISEAAAVAAHVGGAGLPELQSNLSALWLLNDRALPEEDLSVLAKAADAGHAFSQQLLEANEMAFTSTSNVARVDLFSPLTGDNSAEGSSSRRRLLESQLAFWLAWKLGDDASFTASFDRLKANDLLRPWHYLKRWRHLLKQGRANHAWSQMRGMQDLEWINVDQVIELASIYLDLERPTACRNMIEAYLGVFPDVSELWVLQAELLFSAARWDDMRALAGRIRSIPALEKLKGYAFFLEAEALYRDGSEESAKSYYQTWMESPLTVPSLELRMIRQIRDSGMQDLVLRRYRQLESLMADQPAFWQEVFDYALEQGLFQHLADAGRRLHELDPRSARHANNYAAILLASRQRASEAIGYTLSLVQQFPSDLASHINHIHALLQNNRLEEAAGALAGIQADSLSDAYRPAYDLARFEWYWRTGDFKQALRLAETLRIEALLPPQQVWIQKRLDEMLEASPASTVNPSEPIHEP